VLKDKDEGVKSRGTEGVRGQSELDVGIAIDIANKAIEAGDETAEATNETLGGGVISRSCSEFSL
jgi:hypothetical protein